MSLATNAQLSVSSPRVLVELDIGKLNLQWINAGAGIWYINFAGVYPEVGPPGDDLLNGFTLQTFGDIGSVKVDAASQTKVASIAALTNATESYYWDVVNQELWVCLINYDEPSLHTIALGVLYGYSFDEFTPIGQSSLYEGRLIGSPSVSIKRDPLFFGKIQFDFGGVSLINNDGFFDTFAQDNDVYGNEARLLLGYSDLDYSEYMKLFSGTIESINIGEDSIDVRISDKRKQLTKSITYSCSITNALDVIKDILVTNYGIVYSGTYFDMVAWVVAQAIVPDVTIDIGANKAITDIPTIDLIQDICASVFGLFLTTVDGKYSFKIIDTTASASTTIYEYDILNKHSISYDPTEVISSTKVGYAKDWAPSGGSVYDSPYTFLTDTSQEEDIFLKYKVYNQKQFNTVLITLANAQTFSNTVLAYSKDVHGVGEIEVPMKYYAIELGDIVDIELNRETTTMLGTKKCEIIGVKYNLSPLPTMSLGYRII
jgi:hypothetical protein